MSYQLSITNPWTGSGFRENPEQRVSSLLVQPVRDPQENDSHPSSNSQHLTSHALSARSNS